MVNDIPDYMRGFDLDEDFGITPVASKPKSETSVDKKVVESTNLELSKVLIVGAGGLGCPVADLLCRAGVGTIGIIDYDKISLSNINRQTLYNTDDINRFKVEVLKKKQENRKNE